MIAVFLFENTKKNLLRKFVYFCIDKLILKKNSGLC